MKTSETIGKLAEALAKAQGDFGPLVKNAANPFFKSKYSDLASVVDVIRNPLSQNGIAYIQTTDDTTPDCVTVETTLIHSSGEWISGRLTMPVPKKDPQGYGSALTYARRYALQSMVGLAAEDDDAESAVNRTPAPKKPTRPEPVAPKQVTPTQEEIEFFRKVQGDIADVSTDNGLEKYWKSINPSIKDTPLYPDYVNLFKSRKVELAEGKAA